MDVGINIPVGDVRRLNTRLAIDATNIIGYCRIICYKICITSYLHQVSCRNVNYMHISIIKNIPLH